MEKTESEARILIIDDIPFSRQLMRTILNKHGYEHVDEAANGKEGLEHVLRHASDLVLCDIVMPEMDGFTFCKAVRDTPAIANTPIIIQSGVYKPEERAKVFDAGANDLMHQPAHPSELIARVKTQLQKARTLRELEAYHKLNEHELQQARHMHQMLLPQPEQLARITRRYGLMVSHFFEPSMAIGGDMWGIFPVSEQQVGFYCCDFTGHGVGAAMNTFRLTSLISEHKRYFQEPSQLLQSLNRKLYSVLEPGHFATFFYGVIDIANNDIRYAAAGTPPPLLYRAGRDEIKVLNNRGIPIGATNNSRYETHTIPFNASDSICLYSDAFTDPARLNQAHGVTEATIQAGMCKYLKKANVESQQKLKRALVSQMNISDEQPPTDDVTLVIISRQS